MFQKEPGGARDNEVIRIANQMDFIIPLSAAWRPEPVGQQPLESIQCSIRQDGGDDAPLRCPFRQAVRSCFGWLSGMVFVSSLSG